MLDWPHVGSLCYLFICYIEYACVHSVSVFTLTSVSGVALSISVNSSPSDLPWSMKTCLRAASGVFGTGTTSNVAEGEEGREGERQEK